MKLSAALLIACLFALPALGAGPLDALRAESRGLREQVTALRAKQLEGRNELSTLSARIQTLKEESKGKLLPGGELDSALKRSQELSGVLSELSQQVGSRETALETANLGLLDALSSELSRLRTEFDRQTNRDVRKQLIDSMRKLRAEREALRQTLPATRLPALDNVKPSDDPEELLEQADLLRDNEEKLRRELKSLEARIAERRDEAELDKRVQRFMGEESMFDDGDRRLRVQRTVTTPSTAPTKDSTGVANNPNPNQEFGGAAPAQSTFDTTVGTGGAAPPPGAGPFAPAALADTRSGGAQPEGTSFRNGLDSSNIRVTNGSDARVQVGNGQRPIAGGDDDLKDLEVERARLQGLAAQLKKKADELAKRAAELK
ncbi:MAG: TetR family transcriptional regulator [Archangium sp.]